MHRQQFVRDNVLKVDDERAAIAEGGRQHCAVHETIDNVLKDWERGIKLDFEPPTEEDDKVRAVERPCAWRPGNRGESSICGLATFPFLLVFVVREMSEHRSYVTNLLESWPKPGRNVLFVVLCKPIACTSI